MSELPDDELNEPDFEVWNHLESGWQMAVDDVRFKLSPEMLAFYQALAKLIVSAKSQLRVDLTRPELRAQLEALPIPSPDVNFAAFLTGMMKWYATGTDKWLTHLVHLELASQGIWRANTALERFDQVAAQLGGAQPTPEKSLPYLREVVDSFLFGFDAATIALARGTLEQVAREVLLRIGAMTEGQMRRERPDLDSLLARLRQSGALTQAADAATRLRDRGNTVLHQHMYDARIREQMALASIGDLGQVLRELVP